MGRMKDLLVEAEEALLAGDYAKTLELLRPFDGDLQGGKRRLLWELVLSLATQQEEKSKEGGS